LYLLARLFLRPSPRRPPSFHFLTRSSYCLPSQLTPHSCFSSFSFVSRTAPFRFQASPFTVTRFLKQPFFSVCAHSISSLLVPTDFEHVSFCGRPLLPLLPDCDEVPASFSPFSVHFGGPPSLPLWVLVYNKSFFLIFHPVPPLADFFRLSLDTPRPVFSSFVLPFLFSFSLPPWSRRKDRWYLPLPLTSSFPVEDQPLDFLRLLFANPSHLAKQFFPTFFAGPFPSPSCVL